MKKAICVGINNYPGSVNDLNGCINDANDWAGLLDSFGFQTTKILDDQATKNNILTSLKSMVTSAVAGDVVVFTYSGHGTQVLDTSNDEQDSYDEALYVFDGPIIDDELRLILDTANKDAQIIVITDSCFSGTVTKATLPETVKPRFLRTDVIPNTAVLNKPFLMKITDEEMVEILISGCSDSEYSYDAFINGKWNGAMTANAIPLIKSELTYNDFYSKLRAKLPSTEYPQTPQLEGSIANKSNRVFTGKTVVDNGGGTGPDDTNTGGGSTSTGCFSVVIAMVAMAAAAVTILFSVIL